MNKPMKMKRKEKEKKHKLVYTKYARDLNINTACIYKLGKRFLYYDDITKVYSKDLGTKKKHLRRLNKNDEFRHFYFISCLKGLYVYPRLLKVFFSKL